MKLRMPPPKVAVLPDMAELVTIKVLPSLLKMPPPSLAFPPVMVIPLKLTMKFLPIENARLRLLPETVNRFAPGPLMVRFLPMASCVPPRVMVCAVLKSGEKKTARRR